MTTYGSATRPVSQVPGGQATRSARIALWTMLLASAALMAAWSFAVPVFEGPDEPTHWKYAHYLRERHALPVSEPSCPEAAQPPLYYLLIAPLAVDVTMPPIGYVGEEFGKRHLLFPPRVYQNATGDLKLYWPFRLARLVSVLMSVFAVWFCVLAGTEASGSQWTGLLVGGLVAFWPMFSFRGMNVSNDSLVVTLCALTLYLTVRLIRRGFTWRIGVMAALVAVGAFLTKINAVALGVALLLALISEKGPWRAKLLRAFVLGAAMLVIVGPWLIRNEHLYGEALAQMAQLNAARGMIERHSLFSNYFLTDFPVLLISSFIGTFGWMSLPLPIWGYLAYFSGLIFAGTCWIGASLKRRVDFRLSTILACTIVLNLVGIIQMNFSQTQPQGRYLLATLPAIALAMALGLESLPSWSRLRVMLTVGGLAVSNLIILVCLVIPAYWPPVINQ